AYSVLLRSVLCLFVSSCCQDDKLQTAIYHRLTLTADAGMTGLPQRESCLSACSDIRGSGPCRRSSQPTRNAGGRALREMSRAHSLCGLFCVKDMTATNVL